MTVTTISPIGLTHPDTRGEDVEWDASYESNLELLNNIICNGWLRKVSDDTWGEAVMGVEYYSPRQYKGIRETVYRQYFSGDCGFASGSGTASRTNIIADASGIKDILYSGGCIVDSHHDNKWRTLPRWDSKYATLPFSRDSNNEIILAHHLSYDRFQVWLDYTKVEE